MRSIETDRLILRMFTKDDLADYYKLCSDVETMRFLGGIYDKEKTFRHVAFILGHWALRGYGLYAVELKETGEFLGRVGFIHPDGYPDLELAWTIYRPFWGKGYALEAAKACLKEAKTLLPQNYVIHLIDPENIASVRLAEKVGATFSYETEIHGVHAHVYKTDIL